VVTPDPEYPARPIFIRLSPITEKLFRIQNSEGKVPVAEQLKRLIDY
jgi:hypothetical protein